MKGISLGKAGLGRATRSLVVRAVAGAMLLAPIATQAAADGVSDFYQGKQIRIVVGFGPGAAYDGFARLYARFLPKYIPGNPNIIIENKPGAASLIAANYIYSGAPKDGTVLGTINRNMPLLQELGDKNARFDAKNFTWIGSPSDYSTDGFFLLVRKDVAASKSLLGDGRGGQITIAATARGSTSSDIAHLLQTTLNLNVRIVDGYRDDSAMALAIDNREVEGAMIGMTATNAVRPEWMRKGSDVTALLQFARGARHELFPDAPTARELAKDQRAHDLIELAELPFALGFPLIGPPDMPADRVSALQEAYMKMSADPEYLEQTSRLGYMISPVSGKDLLETVKRIQAEPASVKEEMKSMWGQER
jgi:tripartite-type tricarboxylate transporter receptor subunit TctC